MDRFSFPNPVQTESDGDLIHSTLLDDFASLRVKPVTACFERLPPGGIFRAFGAPFAFLFLQK